MNPKENMEFASASIAETAAAAATCAAKADVERAPAGVKNGNENKNEENENESPVTKAKTNDKEQEPLFSFLTGMKADLAARLPLYLSDWGKPDSIYTVANATIFAFVIQLIPALIFAELVAISTDEDLGTVEVLLSAGIIGSLYSILSGQPIVLVGITGPVAILLGTSHGLAKSFDAEYFPFFFWICVWAGIFHCVAAMVGLVSLVWKVTPFTLQIFELFIAIAFVYASLKDLIQPLQLGTADYEDRSSHWASLVVGIFTFYIAWTMHFAETWISFPRQVRVFLTSYNTLLAVVMGTAFSYLPGVAVGLHRVKITAPWDWQPTADRAWVVDPLQGIGLKGIFGAMIPGLMIFLLFFIDHIVSSILTQAPKFNLKKPSAYHWDFFVLGLSFIPCAIFGVPPCNALIPQAPMHTRALCKREVRLDEHGVRHEVVVHVEEQRWSAFGQSILFLLSLSAFGVISWIPIGCLFGLLLYLGFGALHGNEVFERFWISFIMAKKRPQIPVVRNVAWSTVQYWTAIQALCAMTIFGVAEFAPIGYLYPVLLALLVPFRYFLGRFFSPADLKYLDPFGEVEDDLAYDEVQRVIHLLRNDSSDDSDVQIPARAAFHGKPQIASDTPPAVVLTADPESMDGPH